MTCIPPDPDGIMKSIVWLQWLYTDVAVFGTGDRFYTTLVSRKSYSYSRGWSVTSNGGRLSSKPHFFIRISFIGLPRWSVSCCSMMCMIFWPSVTMPNMTCSPFRLGVGRVVMKNWQPFVSGPANENALDVYTDYIFICSYTYMNHTD